jgi:acetamidase/formamidase
MQRFPREAITTHCVGAAWPEMLGTVALGESFVVETVECGPNGPVAIEGIRAGDAIAVHIEKIELEGPLVAPNGGPFIDGPKQPLEQHGDTLHWPRHFRLRMAPSVGNVAVLPEQTEEIVDMIHCYRAGEQTFPNRKGWRRAVREPRDRHCHQDCRDLRAGAVIHMKAQVDGAGLCVDDVHAYIGQGEMAFAGIEANARVQLRVERSGGWHVDWPLIETADEIMVFSSYSAAYAARPPMRYVDVVRQAYRSMCEVAAARIGGTVQEANTIVATAVDIRNCALYGLAGFISDEASPTTSEIAVVAAMPKSVFVG